MSEGVPLILRVAGLPAEVMAPFSHPGLTAALAERESLRERLGEVRAALVDCLHGAIRTSAREERRFLLSVKRSCYNGGDLKAFQEDPQWPLLARAASALVEAAVALESAAEAAAARLEDLYGQALQQEQEALVRLLGDRAFVRGVALASPDLAKHLDRLNGREPASFGRRERRLCQTLLRYASRAALKLSPLSTLTRMGIVLATEDEAAGFAFAPGEAWKERSTVSLRRDLLAQCSCLLPRCRAFALGLPVALNETLALDDQGRYIFFRPGRWELDDESRTFRYSDASSVRARLEGSVIPWLIEELRDGPRVYRHLLDGARTAFPEQEADTVDEGLDELLEIGFLNLFLPWDFSAPRLEESMLGQLDSAAGAEELAGFRSALGRLAGLLAGYAGASSPSHVLEASQRGVEELFQALAPAVGLPPRMEFKAYEKTFEEDVFLLPGPAGRDGYGIAHLSRDRMLELLGHLDPLARLIDLQSSLHDFGHTLAALGERRWPGVETVGLLEFFAAARPLFDQYLRHRAGLAGTSPGFNPFDLEPVKNLVSSRQWVKERLGGCFAEVDEEMRLSSRDLAALLDEVPGIPTAPRSLCAFVQPLDPEGERWVLNSISDGFGRLASRFTSAMDARTRDDWTAYFTSRSLLEADGERVELLDVTSPENRTINVHVPQTFRALKMPGEHTALSAERLLRLSDLRIRLRGSGSAPVLTDRSGQRLLPVQFGSMAAGGAPTLLKFLGTFGSGERNWRLPLRAPRLLRGIETFPRYAVGPIVYSRRKWVIEPPELLLRIEQLGETAVFETVNRWRSEKGIPDCVFVKEPILVAGSIYRQKPQSITFSSPSFVQIFASMLKTGLKTLVLEEALPVPAQFPMREDRWAVEVQLESFAFQRVSPLLAACEEHQLPV